MMRQRVLVPLRPGLRRVMHKHSDRSAYRLVDVDDEKFLVVAKKDRRSGIGRQDGAHFDFDDGLFHVFAA